MPADVFGEIFNLRTTGQQRTYWHMLGLEQYIRYPSLVVVLHSKISFSGQR